MNMQAYFICIYMYVFIYSSYLYNGRYCATYSPFATPIPNPFYVRFFATKRWPIHISLSRVLCCLVSNWDNRRRWRVWGERSLALSFLCFGSIALVVAARLHAYSSCVQPILQNLAPAVSSTPLTPRLYLRLGFLETDWGGEVHADGLLMNALGRHTCKKRRENEVSQKEMLTWNTDQWDPADSTGSSGAGMALQNFPNWEKGPGLLYLCVR